MIFRFVVKVTYIDFISFILIPHFLNYTRRRSNYFDVNAGLLFAAIRVVLFVKVAIVVGRFTV